jgi:hypothetical protein
LNTSNFFSIELFVNLSCMFANALYNSIILEKRCLVVFLQCERTNRISKGIYTSLSQRVYVCTYIREYIPSTEGRYNNRQGKILNVLLFFCRINGFFIETISIQSLRLALFSLLYFCYVYIRQRYIQNISSIRYSVNYLCIIA